MYTSSDDTITQIDVEIDLSYSETHKLSQLVESSLSTRYHWFVFTHIHLAKTNVGMGLQ